MTKREEFENTKEFEKVKEKLMNEEELNESAFKLLRSRKDAFDTSGYDNEDIKRVVNMGFQKGKLKQKKEELEFFNNIYEKETSMKTRKGYWTKEAKDNMIYNRALRWIKERRIKQLSKEIGGIEE